MFELFTILMCKELCIWKLSCCIYQAYILNTFMNTTMNKNATASNQQQFLIWIILLHLSSIHVKRIHAYSMNKNATALNQQQFLIWSWWSRSLIRLLSLMVWSIQLDWNDYLISLIDITDWFLLQYSCSNLSIPWSLQWLRLLGIIAWSIW